MFPLFFHTWETFSGILHKSRSSLKRDAHDDPDFPTKTQTGPGRVGFLNTHVDAYVELLVVRQLELQGHPVSRRKAELLAILHGDAFMDEPAAGKEVERHREYARA